MFHFNQFFRYVIVFVVIAYTPLAFANDTRLISDFIYNIGDKTISIIEDKSLSKGKKEMKLTHLFLNTVDVDLIGEKALGKFWKILNDENKEEFTALYRKHLAAAYVSRFEEYNNETIKVLKVVPEKKQKNVFFALTKLERQASEPIEIGYLIEKHANNKYKIIDISALGISMTATQNSELSSVISRNGLPELFKLLRRKVKFLSKQRPFIIKAVEEHSA